MKTKIIYKINGIKHQKTICTNKITVNGILKQFVNLTNLYNVDIVEVKQGRYKYTFENNSNINDYI